MNIRQGSSGITLNVFRVYNMKAGDLFAFNGRVYMKIIPHGGMNAVNLIDASLTQIDSDISILPLCGELVWERAT
jgi:hypothetical protein